MAGKDLKRWQIQLRRGQQDSLEMELCHEMNETEELHLD